MMIRQRIWRLFCIDGLSPSRIDKVFGLIPGTSHDVVVGVWEREATRLVV